MFDTKNVEITNPKTWPRPGLSIATETPLTAETINIVNKWKRLAECLFGLFDPSDSPTGPTDFEEVLILALRIGLWKSNSVLTTSRSLNTFRHHAARISASISIFYSVAHPLGFSLRYGRGGGGSTVQCILMHMFGTRPNDFCPRDLVIIDRGVREYKVY